MRGAEKVILIDINQTRLDMASKFDIDYLINSSEKDPVEEVLRLTNNIGANKVISANPSTIAQQQAILMTKKKWNSCILWRGAKRGGTNRNRYKYYSLQWIMDLWTLWSQ